MKEDLCPHHEDLTTAAADEIERITSEFWRMLRDAPLILGRTLRGSDFKSVDVVGSTALKIGPS
jgi:hypothetical protein